MQALSSIGQALFPMEHTPHSKQHQDAEMLCLVWECLKAQVSKQSDTICCFASVIVHPVRAVVTVLTESPQTDCIYKAICLHTTNSIWQQNEHAYVVG